MASLILIRLLTIDQLTDNLVLVRPLTDSLLMDSLLTDSLHMNSLVLVGQLTAGLLM
ncbi:hypothetical protein V6Z96_009369 [Aspergillus fumigatus]